MAKPKRKRGDEHAVSLFPFLSILACVIGTLTLMITGLALSQMDSPAVAAALDLEQIEAELQLKQRDVEQLRNDVTASEQSAGRTHRDLQSARAQLAELAREIDRLIERNQQPVEVEVPKVDAAAHQQRMDALRKELQRLKARRDQLLADIKKHIRRCRWAYYSLRRQKNN